MNTPSNDNFASNAPAEHPAAYWRTMRYFSLYRLAIAGILFGTYFLMREHGWWESYDQPLYFRVALGYCTFAAVMAGLAWRRWPRFNRQLTLQAMGDIAFIVLLMYAGGGVKSGLGLLLVVAIAGTSLLSQGRLALFYAAMASIALLLEQSWRMLTRPETDGNYTHVAMLSLSCFATAWLAHALAKRASLSEELASRRGIDLHNLAQVNQLVIRDMLDGVLVVDHELNVRQHNERAEALLGLDANIWKQATLHRIAPPLATLYAEWVAGSQPGERGGSRLILAGRELRLRFLPVSEERTHGAVIFIEDWSRVQAQARQLKLAALGRLTANIAHEIRNPLSAISHASQLLQESNDPDPTTQRLLQIINDNVRRLDQMVHDVLQLSRRDRVSQETLLLGAFLREFRRQFCEVEQIAEESLLLDGLDDMVTVLFDRNHLHQVLWNLCRNGWHHGCKRAGSLTLRFGPGARAGEMELEVADDGPGLAEEARLHLFEPFFTTEANGTGLGLYVARELCEANGANLNYVESATGARFKIYFKEQHA